MMIPYKTRISDIFLCYGSYALNFSLIMRIIDQYLRCRGFEGEVFYPCLLLVEHVLFTASSLGR